MVTKKTTRYTRPKSATSTKPTKVVIKQEFQEETPSEIITIDSESDDEVITDDSSIDSSQPLVSLAISQEKKQGKGTFVSKIVDSNSTKPLYKKQAIGDIKALASFTSLIPPWKSLVPSSQDPVAYGVSDEKCSRHHTANEFVESEMLVPLNPAERTRVKRALYSSTSPETVIGMCLTQSVQFQSFRRLRPLVWLNDELVNFYMAYLRKRDLKLVQSSSQLRRRHNHFFFSHFLTRFYVDGYPGVKRWARRTVPGGDIFKMDKIFIPVNCGGVHWIAIVVFVEERRIQLHDSLAGGGLEYMLQVLSFLESEHLQIRQEPLPGPWLLVHSTDSPQQTNGKDCGVFTCLAIDSLSIGAPLRYSQKNIGDCRKRIAHVVLQNSTGCHHTL